MKEILVKKGKRRYCSRLEGDTGEKEMELKA